jgi:glutamyl-tRNA reductase
MQIVCLGLSHHTAPVALRERICRALPDPILPDELPAEFRAITELAVLSTCNRIEIYAAVESEASNPRQLLLALLRDVYQVELDGAEQEQIYCYSGSQVIEHLARVAAGLDSLVLGEPQILGQVSDAFMQGVETGAIGSVLTVLFRGAIRAGKRARNETRISSNPATISSVSIALAEQIVGNLQQCQVLVVGVGQMGRLTLSALQKRGVENVALVNRTVDTAASIAQTWNGTVYSLDELPAAMQAADVVFSATAAPHTLIDLEVARRAHLDQRRSPLVLLDIAVPRDVDPAVGELEGVQLFNMDNLQDTLDQALAARQLEVPLVEQIVTQEVTAVEEEYRQFAVVPLITDLRQKAEAIRQRELERTLRYLGEDLDPETLRHVQHLSRSLVNKLLHEPTIRLRQKATNGEAEVYAATVRDLFNLSPESDK